MGVKEGVHSLRSWELSTSCWTNVWDAGECCAAAKGIVHFNFHFNFLFYFLYHFLTTFLPLTMYTPCGVVLFTLRPLRS